VLHTAGFTPVANNGMKREEDGNWVSTDTVVKVLEFLELKQAPTWQGEACEFRFVPITPSGVHGGDDEITAPPVAKQLLLLHTLSDEHTGEHFAAVVIDSEHLAIHAFDSLCDLPDPQVWEVVNAVFPSIDLLSAGYTIHNHSGIINQRGATCGAWSAWFLYAYCLNYRGCRGAGDELDVSLMDINITDFWRLVTI
jgi:hypothetical protein